MTKFSFHVDQGSFPVSLAGIEQLESQLEDLKAKFAQTAQEIKSGPSTGVRLKSVIQARWDRKKIFGEDLFADPAWDIFLFLYNSHLDDRVTSTTDVCNAAAVPATTALRWIEKLESSGWISRKPDLSDGRRIMVKLSHRGMNAMQDYCNCTGSLDRGI